MSALPLHANPARNSGGTHFGGIDYTVSQEADKNYFLKGILAIFLGKRTSDDSRPTCVQGSRLRGATARRAGVATTGRRSGFKGPEMIQSAPLRPVAGRLSRWRIRSGCR